MANHVIFIIGSIPNYQKLDDSRLILSDEGDTVVKPGDTVIWINMVASISSFLIRDDNKNSDVFEPDPAPVEGSNIWRGRVRKGNKKKEEHYTIFWSQGGMTFRYDPVIKVNP